MRSGKNKFVLLLFPLFLGACFLGSGQEDDQTTDSVRCKTLLVTATAYNSLGAQGVGDPMITAWGDTLDPNIKSIAVSRDLVDKGLTYRTPVRIKGLEGIYIVNDKMHSRWVNKIDIYMGQNRTKALDWGKRKVQISFPIQKESDAGNSKVKKL